MPALTIRERTVHSGDGFGRARRRSSQIWHDVMSDGRVLATWPTQSQARAHASGLPVVERRGGLIIVWLGSLRAEPTKADFRPAEAGALCVTAEPALTPADAAWASFGAEGV